MHLGNMFGLVSRHMFWMVMRLFVLATWGYMGDLVHRNHSQTPILNYNLQPTKRWDRWVHFPETKFLAPHIFCISRAHHLPQWEWFARTQFFVLVWNGFRDCGQFCEIDWLAHMNKERTESFQETDKREREYHAGRSKIGEIPHPLNLRSILCSDRQHEHRAFWFPWVSFFLLSS